MIAVIDYGAGNLFSLSGSLKKIGEEAVITNDPAVLDKADHLILPGVGAFEDAMIKLGSTGLIDPLKEEVNQGKPLLGICLGMQMLFEASEEFGMHQGLGLIHGTVKDIRPYLTEKLDIPHMGWNRLQFQKPSEIYKGIPEGTYVYFVHSFAAFDCEENLTATADYSIPLTASVQKDNIYGTQFHPEKSGPVGLAILKNFCQTKGRNV